MIFLSIKIGIAVKRIAKEESHSDWVHEKINTYGKEIDIILEAKMKELSLLKYKEQFIDPL